MKKRTKLLTGALTVLAGVLLLSSCTASFCSETDKAHILYAFDYGVKTPLLASRFKAVRIGRCSFKDAANVV